MLQRTLVRAQDMHVPVRTLPRDLANPPLFKLGGPAGRADRLTTIPIIASGDFKNNPCWAGRLAIIATIANDDLKTICVSPIFLLASSIRETSCVSVDNE